VENMLRSDDELCERIVCHNAVVISTPQGIEGAVRNCKEGHMLNIGVVFWRIRDNIMNILVSFPPPQARSSNEICNHDPDNNINSEIVCDALVSHAKEKFSGDVPAAP